MLLFFSISTPPHVTSHNLFPAKTADRHILSHTACNLESRITRNMLFQLEVEIFAPELVLLFVGLLLSNSHQGHLFFLLDMQTCNHDSTDYPPVSIYIIFFIFFFFVSFSCCVSEKRIWYDWCVWSRAALITTSQEYVSITRLTTVLLLVSWKLLSSCYSQD